MDAARRKFLMNTLFGAGWVGLRALASGLPAWMLTDPRRALAQSSACGVTNPQYLILFTSGAGDPLNANVPGMYVDPNIYHPADPTMAPTQMTIGGGQYTAALPWSQLPSSILSRTCFFHHATYTNGHGDAPKVNRLMNEVKRQEMLVSLVAKNLAPCMNTVQYEPAVLSNNLITYAGSVLPVLSPPNLAAVLSSPQGPLGALQKLRDQDVDKLNALFKTSGTKAQQAMLDQYALSQTQARSLSTNLLSDLSKITGKAADQRTDLNIAAAVMIKMNVSPVVVMTYSFGGDNHADAQLKNETTNTVASLQALGDLFTRLGSYGLADKVTMAFQNVFGRTLNTANHSGNPDGRNHNALHHCTVMIGAGIKPSVIGGVTATARDFRATGIDSTTGKSNDTGDIPFEQTLGSVGKTLGRAVGLPQSVLDDQITMGKVVTPALV